MTTRLQFVLCIAVLLILPAPSASADDKPVLPVPGTSGSPAAAPTVLPLVEAWSANTPNDSLNTVFRFEPSRPIIQGSRIYVASARVPMIEVRRLQDGQFLDRWQLTDPVVAPLIGLAEGGLLLVDTEGRLQRRSVSGSLVWELSLPGGVLSAMALDEGVVYLRTAAHTAHAIDLAQGKEIWSYFHQDRRPSNAPPPIFGGAAPLVWPQGVLFGFADGSYVNLSPEDGQVLWSRVVAEGEFPDAVATPVWMEEVGLLLLSSYSGPVVAVTPEKRDEAWRLDFGALGDPVVIRDRVYIEDSDGAVHGVDTETGVEQWIYQLKPGPSGGLLLDGGLLFVSDRHRGLLALDRFTGSVQWRWRPGFRVSGIWHAPATDGTYYVLHTNEGRLQVLRRPWMVQDLSDSQSERKKRAIGG